MRFFLPCILFLFFALPAQPPRIPRRKGKRWLITFERFSRRSAWIATGPNFPRPKGKFGYVLDLKRVAANPDYIVPGHPEKSDLYDMVFKDDMPGEDANVPPLTKDEKEAVRRWIEIGAPEPDPTATGDHTPPASSASVEQKPRPPFWKHALHWIGNLHPVSTHTPIALMFIAVLAEALAWWTRKESWLQTIRFMIVIAALGAIGAASLGWIDAYFARYTGQLVTVLSWHRWLGTATAVWAIICATLVMMNECKEGSRDRQRFRGALLVGAALVGITGFLGSALIYGLDHYAWN